MATQQHLYRRGPIYWWRRVLPIGPSRSYDARISLRTTSKTKARERAGYLTVLAGSGAMLNFDADRDVDFDRRIGAADLKAMYKAGLDEALARFILIQNQLPGAPVINRQLNEASADYYQWMMDTGGHGIELLPDYEAKLRLREYDDARVERLKMTIANAQVSQPAVKASTIDSLLLRSRLAVNATNRRIVEQEMWVAYRDAALQTESDRLHRAGGGTARQASTSLHEVQAPPIKTIEEAMEACVVQARPKTGRPWPSEVQVRTAIKLLKHVTGPNMPISNLTQRHIGELVDLMKALPNRWGRTREELAGGIEASLARASGLEPSEVGLGNVTLTRHLVWVNKVVAHATRRGYGPLQPLRFNDFGKDNRELKVRGINQRAKWTKEEITRLLEAPIFTGCAGIRDVERLIPGNNVYHDGWYFLPVMFPHMGGRSSEFVSMPLAHVHEEAAIPYFEITFSDDRRVKNEQSNRKLPVHPELIRLGFLDYIRELRLDGETMLFPELNSPNSKSYASTYYKKAFRPLRCWAFPDGTDWRHQQGGAMKDKDVYSYRGVPASEMEAGLVKDTVIFDILGHERTTTAGKNYIIITPLDIMLDAMQFTSHFTSHLRLSPLNMRPRHLRNFGSTSSPGGRPKKQ